MSDWFTDNATKTVPEQMFNCKYLLPCGYCDKKGILCQYTQNF